MKKPTPFGKYYLLERINVGGMAEVFRAKAFGVEGFERLVAVKRILPNIAEDKEFIRMFIEEAKLAVQLNHANIAQIFDLGVVDGSYYIALEHVHGRDLRAMFDRCRHLGSPMPVSQACFVVMKVCEGLDYAHNKRDQSGRELHLVHRDVSPQNVLVSFEGEVKLIDFGIAKAAGKGSKTQAGILKGKFGYMSPEQVRGIPVDRRSDVFSCGIVLYELLTGERLFVGESDFSTLEKVRNVEILPPSTYNRRIPDELERIVLKALTKDPDERYQNAIDLHDELQAFVYTAGEFYSRKDLAGWMKKTFGREIEEETAKLESYRQLKAPASSDAPPPVAPRAAGGPRSPSSTASMRRSHPSSQHPTHKPAAAAPAAPPIRPSQDLPTSARPGMQQQQRRGAGLNADALAWDDDELETQIYDNADDSMADTGDRVGDRSPRRPVKSTGLPLAAPAMPAPAPVLATKPPTAPPPIASRTASGGVPDLSSLVSTGKAWGEPKAVAPIAPTKQGWGETTKPPTVPPPNGALGPAAAPYAPAPSPYAPAAGPFAPAQSPFAPAGGPFASGSSKGPAPAEDPLAALAATYAAPSATRDFSPPRMSQPDYDPMSTFGQGMLGRKAPSGNSKLYLAIGGAAAAVVIVVLVIAMTGGDTQKTPAAATTAAGSAAPAQPAGDQNTGFDLYVTPSGTMTWRLDGETRTDRLPSRIRGISPGKHTVAIDAPPGFMSQNMPVHVELGKAHKVEITLQSLDISGVFDTTPPGATIALIVDGKREPLGQTPMKAKLDPRKSYQVLFEKPGYVSVNRPIVFTGALEEKVSVTLEKPGANGAVAAVKQPEPKTVEEPKTTFDAPKPKPKPKAEPKPEPKTEPKTEPKVEAKVEPKPEPKVEPKPEPKVEAKAEPKGEGTLLLNSKPPCEIFIDGKATNLSTPQKDIKLSAGRHRITLVNNEFGIKETFNVDIKADSVEKQIKDYSDRLPK